MSNVCILCVKSVHQSSNPKMSLHVFPACPKMRRIWLKRCKLTNKEVLPNNKICSYHFQPTCFKYGVKRRLLNSDAVPTIFDYSHDEPRILRARTKSWNNIGIAVQYGLSRDIFPTSVFKQEILKHSTMANLNNQNREIERLYGTIAELNKNKSLLISQLKVVKDKLALTGCKMNYTP